MTAPPIPPWTSSRKGSTRPRAPVRSPRERVEPQHLANGLGGTGYGQSSRELDTHRRRPRDLVQGRRQASSRGITQAVNGGTHCLSQRPCRGLKGRRVALDVGFEGQALADGHDRHSATAESPTHEDPIPGTSPSGGTLGIYGERIPAREATYALKHEGGDYQTLADRPLPAHGLGAFRTAFPSLLALSELPAPDRAM